MTDKHNACLNVAAVQERCLASSADQEMGALLVKHWRNDDVRCTVLLLARLPECEQKNSSGIYYQAFLTWDDGRFEYDPAFLLAPFTSGWTTLVDPRKEDRPLVDPRRM